MPAVTLDEVRLSSASWRRMLEATPVVNEAAQVTPDGPGLAVTVPLQAPPGRAKPLSWLLLARKERTVRLDALGKQVWDLCDGTRTVEGIVDAFAQRHHLTFHESRVSVTEYLKRLVQRGALAVALVEPSDAPEVDASPSEEADPSDPASEPAP